MKERIERADGEDHGSAEQLFLVIASVVPGPTVKNSQECLRSSDVDREGHWRRSTFGALPPSSLLVRLTGHQRVIDFFSKPYHWMGGAKTLFRAKA